MTREQFHFYGLTLEAASPAPELVDEVRRDFLHFRVPPGASGDRQGSAGPPVEMRVRLLREAPSYGDLPSVPATVITPRNVCFRDGEKTYIDYFGRALAVLDRRAGEFVVRSMDEHLLHEIAYLFFLSTVGEHLDRRGIHRVHGLGMSYHGDGVLILLPSGGGKSTLALELLRRPGFLLLAEDTPLIDRRGWMLPFPLRLGIRADQETDVPLQHLRTMKRMEFDPKVLIDLDYVADRIGTPAIPRLTLIGRRYLGDVSRIAPMARRHAVRSLLSNMVVGLGVYQGLEFLLERSTAEIVGKVGVASSRLHNAVRLLGRTSVFRFDMGRDKKRNSETLARFIEEACR
jgi:hypothetical protein